MLSQRAFDPWKLTHPGPASVLCQIDGMVNRFLVVANCAWGRHPLDQQGLSAVMDVKLESREGFLLATAAGRLSLAEALELGRNVCDAAVERGLDRILVDCLELEGDLSNGARYELGKTIAEYCRSRSMNNRVAVIGKKPTITGFSARIAANRGATVQTFSERQAGLDWLSRFGSKAGGS